MNFSYETKVGVFVTVLVVLTLFAIYRTGDWGTWGQRGYSLYAVFDSAQGISPETKIYMAGVPIGEVEAVDLIDGKGRVRMRIDSGVSIPQDSTISIGVHGLVGQRYLEVITGSKSSPPFKPDEKFISTEGQVEMRELMNEMAAVARNVRNITEALEGSLDSILTSFEEVGESFRETLPEVLKNLESVTENVSGLIGENREGLDQSLADIQEAARRLEASMTSLANITQKIDEGEGTLGQLVNDPKMADNISQTMENVNALVGTTRRLRVFLGYRGEFQVDPGEVKSAFSLRLQPRDDKFYEIGLVSAPGGTSEKETVLTTTGGVTTRTETTTLSDEGLSFNLLFGKRFYGLTFRFGILQSEGGMGIDYALFRDHLSLSLEAFDFGRDPNPNLRAFADFLPVRYLYLTAGGEDLLDHDDNPILFFGGGIRVQDDDIKSLLGLVATGASAR
ncbi:MAG: MCE family protein [Deltaproteobacteria bacterium]|nr:MCE family protein [Deltaproteobacteria bacterium]